MVTTVTPLVTSVSANIRSPVTSPNSTVAPLATVATLLMVTVVDVCDTTVAPSGIPVAYTPTPSTTPVVDVNVSTFDDVVLAEVVSGNASVTVPCSWQVVAPLSYIR